LAGKYGLNAEKFAAAVEASGKKDAEITLLVNSADSLRVRVAREIAAMLTAGGLKVKMSELSGNSYTRAVKNREFDLYLGQTMLSPNMDLSAFFHTNGALSYGGVDDLAAYTLCLESLANYGNYYSLYKYVMENGLLCPVLVRSYAVYVTRGVITGLQPARDNIFYYTIGKKMDDALLKE
jgi:ABC-type transport system substrate-binding protein